jgi:hypothetical protein
MHQQPLPILSLVAQNFLFQSAVCYFCSKLLQFFCGHMFPNPCWTWISAPWASTQFSYLSCLWSSQNKKYVFVSINKITPVLTDLLQLETQGMPTFCARLLYNVHDRNTGCRQLCSDALPCKSSIGQGLDSVSLIGSIKTHWKAVRNTTGCSNHDAK